MIDKIKAVVVGINFGEWVIENELLNGDGKEFIELVGVCDINREKTDEFAKRYNVKAFYSLSEALEFPHTQAIILITGPVNRAKLIHQILDAGKPVMTTKPFDTSSEETYNVLRRAMDMNIPVFMNSPTPVASGELLQIEQWNKEYNLGKVIGYHASTHCSYREKADGSWYDDPVLCPAAPVFRLGIYLLNDLCRFLAPVQKVQVMQSRMFTQRPTADNALLSILHDDGSMGSVYASFCIDDLQYYRCSIEINFERGTIFKNVGLRGEDEIELSLSANVNKERITCIKSFKSSGAGYMWNVFYDAVKNKVNSSMVQPEQAASVIKIIEEMKKCL